MAKELEARYGALAAGAVTEDRVAVAGRIRAIRNSGMFIDLHDSTGKIQIFNHKDHLPPEQVALREAARSRRFDRGRRHRATHAPGRAHGRTARAVTLLAKALLPLPEKFHGLADIELRYRQRYLDLIMSEESRDTLRRRSRIVASMRRVLIDDGFLEVETPMLHTIPGGASAKPFVTHHAALDLELYLRIAPELHLKRLLVGGLSDKLFEINRNFRNEGLSPRHNPEFTSLELYQAYVDYHAMMDLAEKLITAAAQAVLGGTHGASTASAGSSSPRPGRADSMAELVKAATGVDFLAISEDASGARRSARLGADCPTSAGWGRALEAAFSAKVEAQSDSADPCDRLPARNLAAGQGRPP